MVETNSPLQEEQHEETPTTTVGNGALLDSMIRNNKQIKRDLKLFQMLLETGMKSHINTLQ